MPFYIRKGLSSCCSACPWITHAVREKKVGLVGSHKESQMQFFKLSAFGPLISFGTPPRIKIAWRLWLSYLHLEADLHWPAAVWDATENLWARKTDSEAFQQLGSGTSMGSCERSSHKWQPFARFQDFTHLYTDALDTIICSYRPTLQGTVFVYT